MFAERLPEQIMVDDVGVVLRRDPPEDIGGHIDVCGPARPLFLHRAPLARTWTQSLWRKILPCPPPMSRSVGREPHL